jgi:hypothetical protein
MVSDARPTGLGTSHKYYDIWELEKLLATPIAQVSCSAGVPPVLLSQARYEGRAGPKHATYEFLGRISRSAGVSPVPLY